MSAAQTLVGHINATTGTLSNVDAIAAAQTVAVLALQDIFSGNRTYQQEVNHALDIYTSQTVTYGKPYGSSNKNTLYWGMAAFYAYRAYANSTALELATSSWDLANTDFVTPAMAQSGRLPRDEGLNSSCSSALAGGVFNQHANQSDSVLGAEANGLFISLSAYLYNATHNANYLDAAELSGTFIQTRLYTDGAVVGGFDAANCSSDATPLSRPWYTGLFIEGLAVLADATGNDTWHQALENALPSAVTHNPWYRADGVLQVEPNTSDLLDSSNMLKCLLVRGILIARTLNLGTSMITLIEAFINVQFNAVTTLARLPGSSQFSSSWIGPATSTFDALGGIAAANVLTAGFAVASAVEQTPESDGLQSRHVNIAAIAGGVVSGVTGFIGLGAICFSVCRRRLRRNRAWRLSSTIPKDPPRTLVEPFVAYPTPESGQYRSNEKAYIGDSLSSLAVLPPARADRDSQAFTRTETFAAPDLATVARQVERIAHLLDAWRPSQNVQQGELDLVPPPTAPPQYTRTHTLRS